MRKKNYVVDTNVLLENPQCIEALRNGDENNVFIPYTVLNELDGLKKDTRVSHIVAKVVDILNDLDSRVQFFTPLDVNFERAWNPDDIIIQEIKNFMTDTDQSCILITNDRILQIKARINGIQVEGYRDSVPYISESQAYTGIASLEDNDKPYNCFVWENGVPILCGKRNKIKLSYQHEVWKIRPKNVYQNMALELLLNEDIDLVTLQSEAGLGKTYLALAAAFYLTFEKKLYKKIFVVKPMVEIGRPMGFLPGDVEDKMRPYMRYITDLVIKLHELRPVNRIFTDPKNGNFEFNPKYFEVLPLAFVRGMNLENAIAIVDEMQNMSRLEARALLTRMGEGVKCFCLGDTRQVDNPYLNEANNGLNWVVRKFKGLPNYGHLVLKGDKSRGPITDMVLKTGL